ncbi:unnamed protein product [Pleuronectes platessa]|uniref:Uncharacterized protein n=1 Tax=Pleuronectes platessa TaxID=8262 RepID=A0A9N7U1I7_PLEPL|nr:unnamed protein product [Pleuronectes platessa]
MFADREAANCGFTAEPSPAGVYLRRTLTVWDCRFWLASITAVRGTVSSSSSLPGAGFSRKDIPGHQRWKSEPSVRLSVTEAAGETLRRSPAERRRNNNKPS